MKKGLLTYTLLSFLVFGSRAQNFVIHDVLASSPDASIIDLEIDPLKKRICFQSPDEKLWVCRLDTVSWMLAVPDGKETMIDSNLVPLDASSNSGEWGYDLFGTYIVYSKVVARKRYIALASEQPSGWALTTLMDAPHRMNPHATRNPNDSFAGIHYISTAFANYTKYKFRRNLYQEYWVHGFTDAHWAEGEQVMTGILSNHQVGLFDPANPVDPVQLTFENGRVMSHPYLWRAPELGFARLLFANADGGEIRVYRETSPGSLHFGLYMSFISPSANPDYDKIGSPEPTVYNGQSYITFMASSSECETSCYPGEIWIAKIDSLAPFFRMVSDTSIGVRSDPETFSTSDSLLVYYTEVTGVNTAETFYRLRKCETGIGTGFTTGTGRSGGKGAAELIVYPNPFTGHIALKNAGKNARYRLTEASGRLIWTGRHPERKDFSFLRPGAYYLEEDDGRMQKSVKLLKE